MPIDFMIDHHERLVLLSMHGRIGMLDIVTCAHKIMAISDVAAFNAMANISGVENMRQFSAGELTQLALLFLQSYPSQGVKGRLAVIADSDALYGIAHSFEVVCDAHSVDQRRVGVFRTLESAADFLNLSGDGLHQAVHFLSVFNP